MSHRIRCTAVTLIQGVKSGRANETELRNHKPEGQLKSAVILLACDSHNLTLVVSHCGLKDIGHRRPRAAAAAEVMIQGSWAWNTCWCLC